MKKMLTIISFLGLAQHAIAQDYRAVCDLQGVEISFTYPNPAGSSNFMDANSLRLNYIKVSDKVKAFNSLRASQVYLRRFNGPKSYGNAISAKFVNDQAELVLDLDSVSQTVRFYQTGTYLDAIVIKGVCLLETGE